MTEANKDEQGCLGPKECKYVIMDRYNNYKNLNFPSKHGEVRTTNCQLTTGYCKKHDECTNSFGGYILGCYYDPYPPHLLGGKTILFGGQEGGISVADCIKACGEAGFLLAGLR